jgi:hypothetical protein
MQVATPAEPGGCACSLIAGLRSAVPTITCRSQQVLTVFCLLSINFFLPFCSRVRLIIMSGLEALSLACKVFQIISFGREVITLCRDVYRGGKIEPELETHGRLLRSAVQSIAAADPPTEHNDRPRSQDKTRIKAAAQQCLRAAEKLLEEITFLTGEKAHGKLAATIRTVTLSKWRKERLVKLEKALDDAQKSVNTAMLARMSERVDATQLELSGMDQSLRLFITQLQCGHHDLQTLVSKETIQLRYSIERSAIDITAQLAEEHQKAEIMTKRHVTNSLALATSNISLAIQDHREEQVFSERTDGFLRSLKYEGMNERRSTAPDAYPDTYEWIFAQEQETTSETPRARQVSEDVTTWDSFVDWLRSSDSTYWISGKPACGKTTLVRYILTSPEVPRLLNVWKPDTLICSHLFWLPGSKTQKNLTGFLCGILHQILSQRRDLLAEACSRYIYGAREVYTDWTQLELRSLLSTILSSSDLSVCLFVDGLDEIALRTEISELFTILQHLAATGKVKSCLASRPELHLRTRLEQCLGLRVQDLTRADMQTYTGGALLPLPSGDIFERQKLVNKLVDAAEGVFLWLRLVVESLNRGIENGDSATLLEQRLRATPRDLMDLYQDLWRRHNEDFALYRQLAALLLRVTATMPHFQMHVRWESESWGRQLPVLVALGMLRPELVEQLCSAPDKAYMKSSWEDALVESIRVVRVSCAGLLELSSDMDVRARTVSFSQIQALHFRFIHRTAFDFVTDTVQGREILAYDRTPRYVVQ